MQAEVRIPSVGLLWRGTWKGADAEGTWLEVIKKIVVASGRYNLCFW